MFTARHCRQASAVRADRSSSDRDERQPTIQCGARNIVDDPGLTKPGILRNLDAVRVAFSRGAGLFIFLALLCGAVADPRGTQVSDKPLKVYVYRTGKNGERQLVTVVVY
ncbi:hypothetical protein OG895_37050 [Streptomyces sp. NBC_00201]|uniref:hypothetical protein n=1 Tax=unclassified Streptomyces TaxID=2593676 RepID=UPI00225179B1|nr:MULTISPECIES: hypothetical protein [unclassified Streptomyces]MCX5250744.1 hypothetical protein [Streptomyces sp. NBC_00201]MCX5291327.1 hypothetical protein [Streptomyces sp. NBC_00183]